MKIAFGDSPWESNHAFIFCTFISKALGIHKTYCLLKEKKTRKYSSKCQDKMDFNVEPYQKRDGVMAKYVALLVKVALEQPYKAIDQVELWTLIWPSSLVWTCLHFFIVRIYACFR